ncbi:MAG: hypothetical protein U0325_12425 [Polyangiales bacterium]
MSRAVAVLGLSLLLGCTRGEVGAARDVPLSGEAASPLDAGSRWEDLRWADDDAGTPARDAVADDLPLATDAAPAPAPVGASCNGGLRCADGARCACRTPTDCVCTIGCDDGGACPAGTSCQPSALGALCLPGAMPTMPPSWGGGGARGGPARGAGGGGAPRPKRKPARWKWGVAVPVVVRVHGHPPGRALPPRSPAAAPGGRRRPCGAGRSYAPRPSHRHRAAGAGVHPDGQRRRGRRSL